MAAVATDRAWGNPFKAFKVSLESFFCLNFIWNSIKIIVLIILPCDNYLMCRHDHARVLLEEQKNSSSPATSPTSSQAAFPDDSITRDCVTWTPLPNQYRCLLLNCCQLVMVEFQWEAGNQKSLQQSWERSDRVWSSQEREFSGGWESVLWQYKCSSKLAKHKYVYLMC